MRDECAVRRTEHRGSTSHARHSTRATPVSQSAPPTRLLKPQKKKPASAASRSTEVLASLTRNTSEAQEQAGAADVVSHTESPAGRRCTEPR